MKKISFALILCALSAVSIFAQNITPTPTPRTDETDIIKVSTTLIQLDVTVTDKNGNIVTDLKPEEFEVYENGKKQQITNFSFVAINKTNENIEQPKNKPQKNFVPLPPVTLKTEQIRRTYALVVDDLGLSFPSIFFVQRALRKFVNEQMQDGDLAAIIRTGSGIGALQSFTSDKRQLLAAIDKIKYNSQGRGGLGVFKPIEVPFKAEIGEKRRPGGGVSAPVGIEDDKEFERRVQDFQNENFSVGTLGALNYIIRGMGELPGRKAVMLFSDGFKLKSDDKSNRILDAMRVLADMANRASVVIYTLDPRGLQNAAMANADDDIREVIGKNFNPGAIEDDRTRRAADFLESQQTLRYLAYETGGLPFINQNNLNKGLQKAMDDNGSYYLLGYAPDEETFDAKKNRFNKLEVKVTRPELKVRYRSGFFNLTDEKMRNTARTSQQKIMTALTSPFGANGINLNLYPVYQNEEKNGDVIHALVYIDAKDLKFTQTADGKHKANLDLIAMTFGDNGIPVDRFSRNYTIEVEDKIYRNILADGFVYTLPVPIKKSGAYQFRIALRDTISDKVGSVSQFIEVPNVKKRMALSNIVLDNFTAEEWRKIKLGGDRASERNVLLDSTLRRFKRGTLIRYDYTVYNPKQNRQIETRLRLIKDGKIVYEKAPSLLKTEGRSDLLRLQVSGELTLGKNLEIGSYVLQVIAVNAAVETGFAAQFVEFEIVE